MPEGQPRAIVQIVHGIAEFVERYDDFASYLNSLGFLVVAEDHMGHGQSIGKDGVQGYFHGGWFAAVEDTYSLLLQMQKEYPDVPYILFGHSMGSFMARTILAKYPDSGITAAIICGTGWQPGIVLKSGIAMSKLVCKRIGEKTPSDKLNALIFGSYNNRIEHPRTAYDWLSRNQQVVDSYIAHPLCGFVPSAGLLRDMMMGIDYIQRKENLARMDKKLPVHFIAGGDDPVGAYGKGVEQAAKAFRKAGMQNVSQRIYPMCRHEILNEINKQEIYEDIAQWLESHVD
jgi:alpha-beta hydrolase superfamily lysophospholipase